MFYKIILLVGIVCLNLINFQTLASEHKRTEIVQSAFASIDRPFAVGSSIRTPKPNTQKTVSYNLEKNDSIAKLELLQLIEEAHHSMEGESHEEESNRSWKDFAEDWISNFNLHRFALNSIRWLEMKKADPKYSEHTLNLFYLLGASHTLETLSGPVGIFIANSAGASTQTMALIGTVGGIISIPGLDPVCLLLMSVYKSSDGMQRMTTRIRIITSGAIRAALSATGATWAFKSLFFKRLGIDRIQNYANSNSVTFDNKTLSFSVYQQDDFQIRFIENQNDLYLKSIVWSENFQENFMQNPKRFRSILQKMKSLGYVYYESLLEIMNALENQKSAKLFYVESHHKNSIVLKDFSMVVKADWRLKQNSNLTILCESIWNEI